MSLGILGGVAASATSAIASPAQVIPTSSAAASVAALTRAVAASSPRPTCLPRASLETARALCAKQRTPPYQEAVAAFGAVDPYAQQMALAPCDWALIPECAAVPPPRPPTRAPSTLAPPSMAPPLPPPPEPKKSNTGLIIGGVLVGALVIGGIYYGTRKKAA